jgi:alginate O-acetyltransferase complex protein AlgI
MFFNSLHYALFFPVVFVVAWLLRKRVLARNAFLLIASYYFYACWDWRFLSLILISTLVDYTCGRLFNVDHVDPHNPPPKTRRRRLILLASLITNLGLLGFFKYYDFFVTSAADLLTRMGLAAHPETLNVILPVGISFYTFQTLSYTIDLYRGLITTERSFLNFAVYVAFFPQLVAGPIERAANLLPQFRTARPFNWTRLYTGFYLICWGLFKKVVIADQVATLVDSVFSSANPTALDTVIGVYAFAIQIYCDFSGYTDIARGSARCLGFDLMVNFELPYLAVNPSDFWHRWHISLSTWLRDYLYIPLGGNRKGVRRTYINLAITMILGGLWHGAAWTFVAWGVYHGTLLALHRALKPYLDRLINPETEWARRLWFWVRVVCFFHLTCLGWLLFRAESLGQVWEMLSVLWGGLSLGGIAYRSTSAIPLALMLLFAVVQLVQWLKRDLHFVLRTPVAVRAFVYTFGVLAFIFVGKYDGEAFIYFQF